MGKGVGEGKKFSKIIFEIGMGVQIGGERNPLHRLGIFDGLYSPDSKGVSRF